MGCTANVASIAGERDLPIELLYQDKETIEIYTRPLKPWVQPGSLPVTSQFDFGAFPEGVVDDEWRPVTRVRQFEADNLYLLISLIARCALAREESRGAHFRSQPPHPWHRAP